MFWCSRSLASSGSAWTHRSPWLFATDQHLPVLSDYLSLKQSWERNTRTLPELSLTTPPHQLVDKRNHGRWRGLPQHQGGKRTFVVFRDAVNKHCFSTNLSLCFSTGSCSGLMGLFQNAPSQVPVKRAALSGRLSLSQDPNPVACESSGTQRCCPLVSHDLPKAFFEQGPKPVQTDLSKCLSVNLFTDHSLSSTSVFNQSHVFSVRSGLKYHRVHTGLFHKDSLSSWACSTSKPWALIRPPPQSRCLHQGDAGPARPLPGRAVLSAENEARCRQALEPNMAVYEKEKAKGKPKEGQRGWAAVLVSLCSVGGEPAFLFTLRSRTLKGRHKGDVSFAGGKQDPSDRDVVCTALREAREELGVAVVASSVWGVLKPLRDMSGMLIAPVLANLGPLENLSLRPNPSEVEEVFTISLAHLCSPKNRGYTNFRVGDRNVYTVPVFRNGKHRVWGLTAVALDHTLKIIAPP